MFCTLGDRFRVQGFCPQKYLWYMTVTASRTVTVSKSVEQTVLFPPFFPGIARFRSLFLIIFSGSLYTFISCTER